MRVPRGPSPWFLRVDLFLSIVMGMTKRTALCACLFLLTVALLSGAQGTLTLATTTSPAKVDGVFADTEYSLVSEAAGMKIGLTWTADGLYVGVSAPTAGWVAVGLGAAKMDGAVMYIGYVSGDETRMKVQKGTGHRHADLETNSPARYVMKETGGQTVLELALKATGLIAKGQKSLDVLVAMGGTDSFVSFHTARAGISVFLAQ
jgi:hypothetical protein